MIERCDRRTRAQSSENSWGGGRHSRDISQVRAQKNIHDILFRSESAPARPPHKTPEALRKAVSQDCHLEERVGDLKPTKRKVFIRVSTT